MKFGTKGERDNAVKIFRKAGCQEGGQTIWMKPDLPIEERVRHSFVFGLKYFLSEQWGWENNAIWVEPKGGDDGKLGLIWIKTKQNKDSEVAVTMLIIENKVVLRYGEGWEAYFHHKEYHGFIEIIAAADEKLQAYKTSISKKRGGEELWEEGGLLGVPATHE